MGGADGVLTGFFFCFGTTVPGLGEVGGGWARGGLEGLCGLGGAVGGAGLGAG